MGVRSSTGMPLLLGEVLFEEYDVYGDTQNEIPSALRVRVFLSLSVAGSGDVLVYKARQWTALFNRPVYSSPLALTTNPASAV